MTYSIPKALYIKTRKGERGMVSSHHGGNHVRETSLLSFICRQDQFILNTFRYTPKVKEFSHKTMGG